jgi:hypothetical protein
MLANVLGVLPILTPPLCALTFIMCSKFYERFNSGLGGLFSLAKDLWAFLNELICLPLIVEGWGEQS